MTNSITTYSALFTQAHKTARLVRVIFNSYREAFADSLKGLYEKINTPKLDLSNWNGKIYGKDDDRYIFLGKKELYLTEAIENATNEYLASCGTYKGMDLRTWNGKVYNGSEIYLKGEKLTLTEEQKEYIKPVDNFLYREYDSNGKEILSINFDDNHDSYYANDLRRAGYSWKTARLLEINSISVKNNEITQDGDAISLYKVERKVLKRKEVSAMVVGGLEAQSKVDFFCIIEGKKINLTEEEYNQYCN